MRPVSAIKSHGRPPDVCALCDTPIETDEPGFNGPACLTPRWNRGMVHGTRGTVVAHNGCVTLGEGQYDHLPGRDYPFEGCALWELAAAWARRTFARSAA